MNQWRRSTFPENAATTKAAGVVVGGFKKPHFRRRKSWVNVIIVHLGIHSQGDNHRWLSHGVLLNLPTSPAAVGY